MESDPPIEVESAGDEVAINDEASWADRAAPWAVEDCEPCRDNPIPGFNSKLTAVCRACELRRSKEGGPQPSQYRIDYTGELPTWEEKPEAEEKPQPVGKPKAEKAKDKPKATRGRQRASRPKEEPKPVDPPEPVASKPKVEKPKAATSAKKAAAAKVKESAIEAPKTPSSKVKGLVLYVNAMPAQHPGVRVVYLNELLADEGAELASAMANGDDSVSYYDLDAFKRRDRLASMAADVARELEDTHVVAVGLGQDAKEYCVALERFAEIVVRGVF